MKTVLMRAWVCLLMGSVSVPSYAADAASFLSGLNDGFGSFLGQVRNYITANEPIPLRELPLIASIPMAPAVKDFFNAIKITAPQMTTTQDSVRVSGKAIINGVTIDLYFERVAKGPTDRYDALCVKLPEGGTLSQFLQNVCGIKPLEQMLPQIQQNAPHFKMSDVIDVEMANTFLVAATDKVDDKEFGQALKGINVITNIRLKGLAEPLGKIFGTDLNQTILRGTLAPALSGSSLSVILPGTLKLVPGIETTPVTFGVSFNSLSATLPFIIVPGLFWKCGYTITPQFLPVLKEPLSFEAAAAITPQGAEVANMMTGMIRNIMPGVDLGDAGIGINMDWGILAATGVPISGFSLRGRTKFMQKDIEVGSKISFTAAGGIENLILVGTLKGSVSLEEIVRSGADIISSQVAVASPTYNLNAKIRSEDIPALKIENPRFIFVPKEGNVGGKNYNKGIEISGAVSILGASGEMQLVVMEDGIRGSAKISPIIIKNQTDGKDLITVTSAESPQEGPRVALEFSPIAAQVLLDGETRMNILGEVSSRTLYKLSASGIDGKATTKIFNLYESDIEIKGDLGTLVSRGATPDNYYMTITLKQSGLSDLARMITDAARTINPGFDEKAQAEFDRVAGEIARLEAERDREYAVCTGPGWNWTWTRCRLFWGEIVKRQAAIDGLVLYRDAILKPGVSIVQGALNAASDITQFAAGVIGKGINIKHFSSQARLSEFLQSGSLPRVAITAGFMGKDIELKDLQFSFADMPGTMKNILEQLRLAFK